MYIFHAEVPLDEGFELLKLPKRERLWRGRRFNAPAGQLLYETVRAAGKKLQCWKCGLEATCFIINKGRNDQIGHPTLDLYASTGTAYVLMTRDHIIPKSYGGSNAVENLRVGCAPCNQGRGNSIDGVDIDFYRANPQLIIPGKKAEQAAPIVEVLALRLQKKRARKKAYRKRHKARLAAQRAMSPESVTSSASVTI